MAIVVFDLTTFRAIYPEFSNVSDTALPYIFEQAELYLDNTEYSLVVDPDKRGFLLYLLMAHLCYMRYGNASGSGGTGIVGRLASASEGTVSVGSDAGSVPFQYMWYTQSPYGMDYWQATKVYRMGTYYPGDLNCV
ncbi:MAG: hypothetical protein [Caudoviricetes sp.]|nr:MAG: hypothetical protein [Caudoviricetes sp.]